MMGTGFWTCILAGIIISCDAILVRRSEWGAKSPKSVTPFAGPIKYVIIHHSDSPEVCATTDKCKANIRSIQNYHMTTRKWSDIGYSFAVGGDGNIYEGRGFNVVGSHAPNYNSKSIGVVFIGNFEKSSPPVVMMNAAQKFISDAALSGKLSPSYKLLGHRQVRATTCPGTALFNAIKTWPHWSSSP